MYEVRLCRPRYQLGALLAEVIEAMAELAACDRVLVERPT